jgi:hydroxymethylpyrimidine/phosphomethylpyrimidine kinase
MTRAVLFIGGMDSSGGAGLLRDAATALSLDVPYRVAVTAVTAQSDMAVAECMTVPPQLVASQIAIGLSGGVSVAKIGMLATADIVAAVAASLPLDLPLVVDPVLRASSGGELLTSGGLDALIELLLPRATLLTPNLVELSVLAARLGVASADEKGQAQALLETGCRAVLIKGGHSDDIAQSIDRLYRADRPMVEFHAPRLAGTLRGTGCQLSSAIAVRLLIGQNLETAVRAGKATVLKRFIDMHRHEGLQADQHH